uniref:Uncharacterized protein n=1 Tax=Anguilla anguilla TaxID=7936 RepID=A0A0E9RRA3_ANGAN
MPLNKLWMCAIWKVFTPLFSSLAECHLN